MHHINLETLTLLKGSHASREDGVCLLEAVAWWAGEEHNDAPACVSPVLAAFGRSWNDGMRSNEERSSLVQYIQLLVGTSGQPEADEVRAWMALDWLIRVHTVAWLKLAGDECVMYAKKLQALPTIMNLSSTRDAQEIIIAAQSAADAAWDRAWQPTALISTTWITGAAWDTTRAAGTAALTAELTVAGFASVEIEWTTARMAAWAAATVTWTAARVAAWTAAREAVETVVKPTWTAAREAAWVAAWAKLELTAQELQESTHDLFHRMILA